MKCPHSRVRVDYNGDDKSRETIWTNSRTRRPRLHVLALCFYISKTYRHISKKFAFNNSNIMILKGLSRKSGVTLKVSDQTTVRWTSQFN